MEVKADYNISSEQLLKDITKIAHRSINKTNDIWFCLNNTAPKKNSIPMLKRMIVRLKSFWNSDW